MIQRRSTRDQGQEYWDATVKWSSRALDKGFAARMRQSVANHRASFLLGVTVSAPSIHDMFNHKETVSELTDNPFLRLIYLGSLIPHYPDIVAKRMPSVYHCHVTNSLGVEFLYEVSLAIPTQRTWREWLTRDTTHRICYVVVALKPEGSSYTKEQLLAMTRDPSLSGLEGLSKQSDDD